MKNSYDFNPILKKFGVFEQIFLTVSSHRRCVLQCVYLRTAVDSSYVTAPGLIEAFLFPLQPQALHLAKVMSLWCKTNFFFDTLENHRSFEYSDFNFDTCCI